MWQIENRAMPAFGDMTFYGQKIDVPGWKKIIVDNQKIFDDQIQALNKFFGQVYGPNLFGETDINYKSTSQVLFGLQMMGVEVDGKTITDTSKETFS